MSNYAISDGSRIVNVIVAYSQEIAEQTTGMAAIETYGEPWIDWTLEDEGWRRPSPFLSWVWSGSEWIAPLPRPEEGNYVWDEDTQNWILIEV